MINTLTSLRIFFALMVFGAHCYVLDTSFDAHFFKEGFVGVSFFFVLYETNIEIANWGRVIHQECLLYMDIHHINRLYLPAKERYEQLLREQPDVIHRAQLGYIASFLGMTPQHLSRLRSES